MRNYRTFLAGLGLAVFVACMPVIQKGGFDLKRDWPYLLGAALTAISGYVQKDAKVTGLPDDKNNVKTTITDGQQYTYFCTFKASV